MKHLCLFTLLAFGSATSAVMPRPVSGQGSSTTETAAEQDVPPAGTLTQTGGPEILSPAAGLVLSASILAYALFRRRRRI